MPQLQKNPLNEVSVDDINDTFRKGYIPASKKNDLMRRKAALTLDELVENQGVFMTYWTQSLKHVQENWDEFVEVANKHDPEKSTFDNLKLPFQLMWNQVGLLIAPMQAFGEVNGMKAEQLALKAGASPGLAKVINIGVDVGSGFIPVAGAIRSAAKGIQQAAPAIAARIGKGAKAAEGAVDPVAAEKVANDALAQGLKADGVTIFRGGESFTASKVDEFGTSFTTNKKVADAYMRDVAGGVVETFKIKAGAKVSKFEDVLNEYATANGLNKEELIKYPNVVQEAVSKWAREQGIDVIDMTAHRTKVPTGAKSIDAKLPAGTTVKESEIRVLNPDAIEIIKPPSPQSNFYESLRRFHREMGNVTEKKAHAETLKEAAKLGIGLDDVRNLFPGVPMNEVKIAAYLKALDAPTDDLIAAAKAGLAGDTAQADAAIKKLMDYFSYAPKFRSAEVTGGRTVEILKEEPAMKSITNMMLGWDPESMAKGAFDAAKRTILEDIAALADEPGKLKALQVQGSNGLREMGEKWWGYSREAFINLLLARPITWGRQIIGNSVAMATRNIERELAGWLSVDQAKGIVKHEGWAQFRGQMAGLSEGIAAFGDAFKRVGADEMSRLDFIPHKIPGVLGRIMNSPGDIVRGIDNFTRAVSARGDNYAMALRKGERLGLEGNKLAEYAAQRSWHPTQDMMAHARTVGEADAFMQDLGTFGKATQKVAQWGPLSLYFPFWKSPINLLKWGWHRTPGLQLISQQLYKDILAGGELADMAVARLTLSNMVAQFAYGLAQQGMFSGGGPADPQLRRAWQAVNQPYSIRGGDGNWYPIQNVAEPGTTPLEIIADFAEIRNQLDDPTSEQTGMAILLTISRDILDNSWWQTMGRLVDVAGSIRGGESVTGAGGKLLASPLSAVTTGGPLGMAIERAIDPVRREARGWVDDLRKGATARVFGFHKDMPPMRDAYGDPIMPPQALGGPWVGIASPFTSKAQETDRIKQEGARLQVKIPAFPWSTGGGAERDDFDLSTALPGEAVPVPLTPQQRDRWQVMYRNVIRHPDAGLEAMMTTNEYKAAPYALQRELFMKQLAQSRENAKVSLMVEDTGLAKKIVESTAGRYLPMIQPEQRQEMQGQIGESLDLLDTLLPQQQENLLKWGLLDSGQERDEQIIRAPFRAEITKSISELNAATKAQGVSP